MHGFAFTFAFSGKTPLDPIYRHTRPTKTYFQVFWPIKNGIDNSVIIAAIGLIFDILLVESGEFSAFVLSISAPYAWSAPSRVYVVSYAKSHSMSVSVSSCCWITLVSAGSGCTSSGFSLECSSSCWRFSNTASIAACAFSLEELKNLLRPVEVDMLV
jgi:hypothetical protein